jgi:hypothetical protein
MVAGTFKAITENTGLIEEVLPSSVFDGNK